MTKYYNEIEMCTKEMQIIDAANCPTNNRFMIRL